VKNLEELFNREDSAWPWVQQWISEATDPVEVFAAAR